nr:NUDIX domain-containing protein [Phycisphaerales bacterium]
ERDAQGVARVLLCVARKHTDSDGKSGYAFLPGGHVEFGESAPESLAREMLEECGVSVRVGALVLSHEATFAAKREHHEVNLVFAMKRTGGAAARRAAISSREDHIEFRWVSKAELRRTRLLPPECKMWLIKQFDALANGQAAGGAWLSGVGRRG